eukprot:s1774_g8.t1
MDPTRIACAAPRGRLHHGGPAASADVRAAVEGAVCGHPGVPRTTGSRDCRRVANCVQSGSVSRERNASPSSALRVESGGSPTPRTISPAPSGPGGPPAARISALGPPGGLRAGGPPRVSALKRHTLGAGPFTISQPRRC